MVSLQAKPPRVALAPHTGSCTVLTAPLLVQLTAQGPGRRWRLAQVFGTLHPGERPGRSS